MSHTRNISRKHYHRAHTWIQRDTRRLIRTAKPKTAKTQTPLAASPTNAPETSKTPGRLSGPAPGLRDHEHLAAAKSGTPAPKGPALPAMAAPGTYWTQSKHLKAHECRDKRRWEKT